MFGRIRRLIFPLLLTLVVGISLSSAVADEASGWPRELVHDDGTVLIYQPQIESLEGDKLRSRAAVSVTLTEGEGAPIFGVVWSDARVLTDRAERTVQVVSVDITDIRFPNATDEHKDSFKAFVEPRIAEWDMVISLDQVLASLAAVADEEEIAEGLKNDPPKIIYSDVPAVLIVIDGEPRYKSIDDDDALSRLVNSPYTIVLDTKKKTYYLDGGVAWYRADGIMGPWAVTKPPKKIRKLRPAEAEAEAKKSAVGYTPPRIIVVTDPTELIATGGKAEYAPVEGTTALYVTNAESDVLMDVDTQEHFAVFSGRWYRSKTLNGPWAHVPSRELPSTFAEIPVGSDHEHLLTFVAGTVQAREAVMDNRIPQTAAVSRGSIRLQVVYDGEPKFEPIDGTEMEYALNTSKSVLKIDGKYWVCDQAVWYLGESPKGPWKVADFRPDDVDRIPPDNPHYNTKYVHVYDSTPDVVYVGYTPGYVGSYAHGGCVVYGTGWYYPSWYGHHYYPHHATWGFNVNYNPWYGWGVGVSWSNGPFTVSIGGYGGYGYGYGYPHSYWGAGGFAYVPVPIYAGRPVYRPPTNWNPGNTRPGNRPGNRPGINPPDSGRPGGRDNLYKRPENAGRIADPGTARRPGRPSERPNDVFAGRDGNVYQRDGNGGWSQRQGDGWKGVDPGTADRARERAGDRTRPSTGSRSGTGRSTSGLEREYQGRTRGTQRASGYQGSRSGSRATPRGGSMGGRSRGGGGRRR
ncbi:MAG: carbohydrate-binding family V/XII [Acidobacteriota bacterium]|nr:carbohydrate-binding family V/XII [Acidobacteriota bacterium]